MMPTTLPKRNAISLIFLGIVSVMVACNERIAFEVVLRPPATPDPFVNVALLRVSADLDRGVQPLAEVRWDQGPVRLPLISNPAVQRIVVEGLNESGQIIASGISRPLDVLAAAPDEPVAIDFTQVAVLSTWPESDAPRHNGRAVSLGGGRWVALGGTDEAGCARTDVRVFGPERTDMIMGPALPAGRTGEYVALGLNADQVLVAGGHRVVDCDRLEPPLPWRIDVNDPTIAVGPPLDWPRGAAIDVLSDRLVLAAGGWGPFNTARTEVFSLDPSTFFTQVVGSLSIPRAAGTLVALGQERALMLGGQTQTATASALMDASVFEPSRGVTLDERITLGEPVVRGPAIRAAAGSVILLSPDVDGSNPSTPIKAVTVKADRSIPLGDVTAVTTLTSSTVTQPLIELADGSLLKLAPDHLEWIHLLPAQTRAIPHGFGPLYGGALRDGNVLFFDAEGRRLTFNPGPAAALGWRGPSGRLVASEGPNYGLGLVPRRPARWSLTRDGLEGTHTEGEEEGEWLVAVDRTWTDFELTVEVRAELGGQAFVLWSADRDRFTFAEFGTTVRIDRRGGRAPNCPTVDGPATPDASWSTRVRVVRSRRRVTVEYDGGPALQCSFDDVEGWLGLGVSRGEILFRDLTVGL